MEESYASAEATCFCTEERPAADLGTPVADVTVVSATEGAGLPSSSWSGAVPSFI